MIIYKIVQAVRLVWTITALLVCTLGCSSEAPPDASAEAEQALQVAPPAGQCLVVTGQFQAAWSDSAKAISLTCLSVPGSATITGTEANYHVTYVDPYEFSQVETDLPVPPNNETCALCCCGSMGEPVQAALSDREVTP